MSKVFDTFMAFRATNVHTTHTREVLVEDSDYSCKENTTKIQNMVSFSRGHLEEELNTLSMRAETRGDISVGTLR